jgi:mRNA interferase MazF
MRKEFDQWNTVKKEVNARELSHDFFYHSREVWWCSIGANVDVETDGKQENFERPVLVVRKFNKEMFWGIPLTSRERTGEFYYKMTHDAGISWAMLSQLKTFSSKRLLRKIGRASKIDFVQIQKKLQDFITIEPPHKEGVLGARRH